MSEAYDEITGYRFDGFTLDLNRRGLYRDGVEVRIRPRSLDVLCYLVERRGRLVSREELMEALWQGSVVTEDAITQCLIDIRRAIGDKEQTKVRTVPRRGYIFELPTEAVMAGGSDPAPERRRIVARHPVAGIAVLALALGLGVYALREGGNPAPEAVQPGELASSPSIAVMPFENMSPDSSHTYLADGVSEEIINSLARQQGLKVIARTSSFSFRDQGADVTTIAERLDVSHVLEGSVRTDGEALRINVQLVDAGNGNYVWNEQFDREISVTSIFDIQSEIASAVVESLLTELSPRERAQLVRVPTQNMVALEAYFEARQAMETRKPAELDRAAELLRRAIELDSDFALAHVSLAETLRLQSNYGGLPARLADERGMAAVRAALAIDDRLGQAYASLGNLLARAGDEDGAERAYRRGIELSPSYAPLYQWYGEFLVWYGRAEEGLPYSRIATALDPRSSIINVDYAEALAGAGRIDESLERYDAVLELDPDFLPALTGKSSVLHGVLGRVADVAPLLERAMSTSPNSPFPPSDLARAYLDLGDLERAATLVEDALRIAPDHVYPLMSRFVLDAVEGRAEEASRSAERIVAEWGGYWPAMRYLRDRDVAGRNVQAALDRYSRVFPQLFGEEPPDIDATNYGAAIDAAWLLKLTGRHERAEVMLERCLRYVAARPKFALAGTGLADVKAHAIRGDLDKAVELLDAAVAAGWRSNWRFELEYDPALEELREQPGYEAVLEVLRADMNSQRERLLESTEPVREKPAARSAGGEESD
ncbi:MAG: winged helix-turn-helix domain-containing protein [Woeseiaceae bacterium]|nr:winged helix-turn-helix domain-containing protein [Woeseiaceae bacterium]